MLLTKRLIQPKNFYFICSNRRSGGTLLCDILQQLNVAGYPAEYFNPYPQTAAYRKEYVGAKAEKEFISKLIEKSTTLNGVCGTKLHSYEIPTLLEKIAAENLVNTQSIETVRGKIEARFPNPKYIRVLRKNKIRQAISLYKALSSKLWWEFTEQPPMYQQIETPNTNFEYNFEKIRECLVLVQKDDTVWEHFFTYNQIEPLVVYYEDFITDHVEGTKKILAYLGLPTDISIPEPRTRKQSDETSLEWEKRFRKEFDYQED